MVKLTLRERESIQEAVRRFRKLVERSGIKKEMRRREYYEKPSEIKRCGPTSRRAAFSPHSPDWQWADVRAAHGRLLFVATRADSLRGAGQETKNAAGSPQAPSSPLRCVPGDPPRAAGSTQT